jgi:hypothetical protein
MNLNSPSRNKAGGKHLVTVTSVTSVYSFHFYPTRLSLPVMTFVSCRVRAVYKILGMDDFQRVHVQMIGAEDSFGEHKTPGDVSISISWIAWVNFISRILY